MISVSQKNLQYPLDVSQLYWLRTRAGGISYSAAYFFFANSDASLLVPAMDDEARFISALQDAIAQLSGAPVAIPLQNLLDELMAAQVPVVPRYPAAGDTGVSGRVLFARKLTKYISVDTPPLPPIWVGLIVADIAANGYSTWPAYSADVQFSFQFRNSTEICDGQAVHFDIAQGKYSLYATNITAD